MQHGEQLRDELRAVADEAWNGLVAGRDRHGEMTL
jgi:hypothetical protein